MDEGRTSARGMRLERLRSEVVQEGLPLADAAEYPRLLEGDVGNALELLLEEILEVRHVEVHEGYRPSLGSFIVADLEACDVHAMLTHIPSTRDAQSLADTRKLVDGARLFLFRDLQGRFAVGAITLADELGIVDLCQRLSAVCVQRLADGVVKVYLRRWVCINVGYEWRRIAVARQMIRSVIAELDPPSAVRTVVSQRLATILEVCVHLLSARRVGATLVWRVSSQLEDQAIMSKIARQPAVELNVFEVDDRYALAALLATVDGACFLEESGKVSAYMATLDPSPAAKAFVKEDRGTRHTSAKRYSYDARGSIVFVVSADGPVTVYSEGALLVRLDEAPVKRGLAWTTEVRLDVGAGMQEERTRHLCPECGKMLVVRIVHHARSTRNEVVDCPVCGHRGVEEFEQVVSLMVSPLRIWSAM